MKSRLTEFLMIAIVAALVWFEVIEPRINPDPQPAPVVIEVQPPAPVIVEPAPTAVIPTPWIIAIPPTPAPTEAPAVIVEPFSAVTAEAGIVTPGLNPAAITPAAAMATYSNPFGSVTGEAGTNP